MLLAVCVEVALGVAELVALPLYDASELSVPDVEGDADAEAVAEAEEEAELEGESEGVDGGEGTADALMTAEG